MRGLLAPLASPVYRSLWLASLASNLGTLMQGVAVAWVMTSLTSSPLLVALVPVSALSPVLLFGLFGGALADTFSKRKFLICTQLWMMMCAAGLGALVLTGSVSPSRLLMLTFALGMGNALNIPAWQSLVQDIVPKEHVASAVALNSISFNAGRTLGPVFGGIVVAVAGAATVFFLNATSFLGTVLVLSFWRENVAEKRRPRVWRALADGFLYMQGAAHLRSPLFRVCGFSFFASASVALLPLLAREYLSLNASEYGFLLGFFGFGSMVGGVSVPWTRRLIGPSAVVSSGAGLMALGMALLAATDKFAFAAFALFLCGLAWVSSLVNLNVAVQTSVLPELRGRAMSFYFTLFQGFFAAGAFCVGVVAKAFGIPVALWVFALGMAVIVPLTIRHKLPESFQ